MNIAGKEVVLYPGRSAEAPLVVLNTVHGEGEEVLRAARSSGADLSLLVIGGLDWNRDLSPWEAPALSRGDEPFSGGADAYLEALTGEIMPRVMEEGGLEPGFCCIAGYSLAGLFSLYSLHRTDAFSRAASVSGSLWFQGACEFFRSNDFPRIPDRIYLSLGDKESKARHPVLSTVEDRTREAFSHYQSKGIESVFELNPGNHFRDAAGRMARGIRWILEA